MAYGIPACCILINGRDHGATPDGHDPTAGDGSWWGVDGGKRYSNREYCVEVMIEAGLNLDDAAGLDCVTHRPEIRCIDGRSCAENGDQIRPRP